jgi:4-hydroxy-tetrahydrodipicolinate reductase
MQDRLKLIQYGVGPIGASIVKLVMQKKGFEYVGAVDIDPNKAGRDLGDIAGVGRKLGVAISSDAKKVFQTTDADVAIHTTASFLKDIRQQILDLVNAELDVVSTSEELTFPFLKSPQIAKEIDDLARKKGVTVLATGVNPGFLMDVFPLTVTSVCQDVQSIKVTRVMDASIRRLPFQKKIGAGMTVEQFKNAVAGGRMGHIGLPESIAMIAAGLGWRLDDIQQTIEPVIADRALKTQYLSIDKGQVSGLHQVGKGIVEGRTAITLDFWAHVGATDPRDSVFIEGTPNVDLTIKGGVHGDLATAAMVVNSIPRVVAGPPGLVTMKDLPVPRALLGDITKLISQQI